MFVLQLPHLSFIPQQLPLLPRPKREREEKKNNNNKLPSLPFAIQKFQNWLTALPRSKGNARKGGPKARHPLPRPVRETAGFRGVAGWPAAQGVGEAELARRSRRTVAASPAISKRISRAEPTARRLSPLRAALLTSSPRRCRPVPPPPSSGEGRFRIPN